MGRGESMVRAWWGHSGGQKLETKIVECVHVTRRGLQIHTRGRVFNEAKAVVVVDSTSFAINVTNVCWFYGCHNLLIYHPN